MKISFSTLGCPGWSWEDMLVTAKDLGFGGIEIRGIENELYVPNAKPFLNNNIEATLQRLEALKLEIPCLTSACYLFEKEKIEAMLDEGKKYIDLAQRIGTPYVRVLGDRNPEPSNNVDIDFVAEKLSLLANYAEGKDVKVLIETNGIFADSSRLLKLLKHVGSINVGVLWDIHHPYRYMNEAVIDTYAALKEYISFVHIKDSNMEEGKVRYRMLGYGDIPVQKALEALKDGGYQGFVSLEWVKRWCLDLEEPGVVFSHFVNYIQNIIK